LHRDNVMIQPEARAAGDVIRTKEFARCVAREYPPFDVVFSKVKGKQVHEWAWHQHWALTLDETGLMWVMYKGKKVGWLGGPEGKSVRLGEEYQFLKESYEEATA